MNDKEREALYEVQDDGQVLVLMDGRRLRVDGEHTPTTCLWLPTAEIELEDNSRGGGVIVTNLDNDERITAQWE